MKPKTYKSPTESVKPSMFAEIYLGLVNHYCLLAITPGTTDHARYRVRQLISTDSDFENLGKDVKKAINASKKSGR